MWIVQHTQKFIKNRNIEHCVHKFPPLQEVEDAEMLARLPGGSAIKSLLLKDQFGLVLAVIPAANKLNLGNLCGQMRRRLEVVGEEEHRRVMKGMHPKFTPPLGDAYGIKTIIDEAILNAKRVLFSAGDNTNFIETSLQGYLAQAQNATFLKNISIEETRNFTPTLQHEIVTALTPQQALQERLTRVYELPPMPEMTRKLLYLRNNPYSHVNDLREIVALDPSLTLQVIHYANSPFYGVGRSTTDIGQAIQILGFDMVLNLCLGLAATKAFNLPKDGLFEIHTYWYQTLLSATIIQHIGKLLPREIRPQQGVSYLSGLLHNFGQLLLGHILPAEFTALGQLARANPDHPIEQIELDLLGFHHGHLDAALLEHWGMPDELVVCCREHHNAQYHGPHSTLVRLNQLTDIAMCEFGALSNCHAESDHKRKIMDALQITDQQITETTQSVIKQTSGLSSLALKIVA
ncbi:MAG: HDOD domain-containing protein [Pseudomonadota bacterium]